MRLIAGDSPAYAWAGSHPNAGNQWGSTAGGDNFVDYVVAFSTSFPETYSALNAAAWAPAVVGMNDGSNTWVDKGSSVAADTALQPLPLVSGQQVQVLGPSLVGDPPFTWKP